MRVNDVFIADAGYNRVVVAKPNGSGGYTQSVIGAGLSQPTFEGYRDLSSEVLGAPTPWCTPPRARRSRSPRRRSFDPRFGSQQQC